jgi:hypothetical protein
LIGKISAFYRATMVWRLKEVRPTIATVLIITPELQHEMVRAQHKTLVGGAIGIAWQVL